MRPPSIIRYVVVAALAGCIAASGFAGDDPSKPAYAKTLGEATKDLKQLALAVQQYEKAVGHIPPAELRDQNGKPTLSWRVAILPYLEQDALYKQFKLDEPWDSDNNKKLIGKMPAVFRGPNKKLNDEGKTVYLAPIEKSTVFPPDGSQIRSVRSSTACPTRSCLSRPTTIAP